MSSNGYELTLKVSETIREFFDAIDESTIYNVNEKENVLELLDDMLMLLSDNQIINGFKIDKARELIYRDCIESKCKHYLGTCLRAKCVMSKDKHNDKAKLKLIN